MKRSQQKNGLFFRSENRFLVRKGFFSLYLTENTVNIKNTTYASQRHCCGVFVHCGKMHRCDWCNKKAEQPIASQGGDRWELRTESSRGHNRGAQEMPSRHGKSQTPRMGER